jgi:hypothetical protein
MKKLDNATTEVKAAHITRVTSIFTVTARAEHIPNICKAIGLFSIIGANSSCFDSLKVNGFISC